LDIGTLKIPVILFKSVGTVITRNKKICYFYRAWRLFTAD